MKKIVTIMLCLILALSMVACGNTGTPDNKDDFEDAQKSFDDIESSTNKSEIEKTVKSVFGVDISLPNAESYSADTMELSGSSMYIILVTGSEQNAEEYYNSVKSKFSKWTALDSNKSFSYETEKVTYGCVIANEGDQLSIAFSMTDQELIDAFKDFVGDTSSFRAEIKELSGVDITFPDIVTSVSLPSSNNDGSRAYYSGTLLSGSQNMNATDFQTVIDALTPQLTGYTKGEPVQGENSTTVQWVNDYDPSKFFKIVLNDYDGTTWVSFSYNYTDRSLLDPWPATELESFLGVANVLPEYAGDYRRLEVEYNPENNANSFRIELSSADETEFNNWVTSLETAGFVEETVERSYGDPLVQYTKEVSEGVFLIVQPSYSSWYTRIYMDKEVYTNLNWPTEALVTAYGQQAANAIPQIDKASKRSFVFEETAYSYDKLTVSNNVPEELFDEYCNALVAAGFELTQSSTYSKNNVYKKEFDNWDKLQIIVTYVDDSYSDGYVLKLEITFTEYTGFGFDLPENVEIVYTDTFTMNDNSSTTETRIIKIGENYYVSGSFYGYDMLYCEFDSTSRTWTMYKGVDNEGTVTWTVYKEDLNRASFDTEIKGVFQGMNKEAKKSEPVEMKTYLGVSCTKYGFTMSVASYTYVYEYWVDENTGIVYDYKYVCGDTSNTTTITKFDTTVTSFGDIALPE